MNATDQKKCAHPQCSCPVSQGKEYRSEACEISAAETKPKASADATIPSAKWLRRG